MGDARRLRRALDALLHNATQYCPQGGDLTISLTNDESSATLRITDTGAGITEKDLPRIFERFYRGEPVDERGQPIDVRGTGQGLFAVKTIVEAHGGTVAADSQVGAGTTLTIRLPLARHSDTGQDDHTPTAH